MLFFNLSIEQSLVVKQMSWQQRSVVITGGAGFIGSHLVECLVQLGANVTVIDNFERGDAKNVLPYLNSVKCTKGDLRDSNFAKSALRGSEIVFDLASKLGGIRFLASYPALTIRANLQITLNTIEAARMNEVDKYLFVSSSCVYGNETPIPHREYQAAYYPPESAYGWSKITGEAIARSYNSQYGMKVYIVRPFNVYGPRENLEQSPHVIPQFITSILHGYPIVIYGDGEQTRSFTFVSDAVDGIMRAVQSNHVSVPFNIGSEDETSINELARLTMKLCGTAPKVEIRYEPAIMGEIRRRVADSQLARTLLGWTCKIGLEGGLKKTIEWHRHLGKGLLA
jgi:nucleoside-diphosphate-sugar epimerase